ncbi:sulfotransferase [Isoptericola hypogeus]|uniref:sulfotransferase n=1 Tax=Isoptericola hypogeus TaxID=300179 RepID=UPI0031DE1075
MTSPVSLVGWGRSGTTFVTNVFRRHPDFRALGETADVVFSTYGQIERSLAYTGPIRGGRSVDTAARDAVHAVLVELYGSGKPRWFQKPIMVPGIADTFPSIDAFGTWYWATFRSLFPDGRVLTVVRDPAETVRSSMIRWGGSVERNFARLDEMLQLLLHRDSLLERVFTFESLQETPEAFIRGVLEFADARFDPACLETIKGRFAVNPVSDISAPTYVPGGVAERYDELRARAMPLPEPPSSLASPVTSSGG